MRGVGPCLRVYAIAMETFEFMTDSFCLLYFLTYYISEKGATFLKICSGGRRPPPALPGYATVPVSHRFSELFSAKSDYRNG